MEGVSETSAKIARVRFRSGGIFTNALLHTKDTTQLIRDIRDDEMGLFVNRSIADIDHEVMNNVADYDEKLLEDVMGCSDATGGTGGLQDASNSASFSQTDFELLDTIRSRLRKIADLGLGSNADLALAVDRVAKLLAQADAAVAAAQQRTINAAQNAEQNSQPSAGEA